MGGYQLKARILKQRERNFHRCIYKKSSVPKKWNQIQENGYWEKCSAFFIDFLIMLIYICLEIFESKGGETNGCIASL
jgi:hypothetical protein